MLEKVLKLWLFSVFPSYFVSVRVSARPVIHLFLRTNDRDATKHSVTASVRTHPHYYNQLHLQLQPSASCSAAAVVLEHLFLWNKTACSTPVGDTREVWSTVSHCSHQTVPCQSLIASILEILDWQSLGVAGLYSSFPRGPGVGHRCARTSVLSLVLPRPAQNRIPLRTLQSLPCCVAVSDPYRQISVHPVS